MKLLNKRLKKDIEQMESEIRGGLLVANGTINYLTLNEKERYLAKLKAIKESLDEKETL